jgi:hypothetical protein
MSKKLVFLTHSSGMQTRPYKEELGYRPLLVLHREFQALERNLQYSARTQKY